MDKSQSIRAANFGSEPHISSLEHQSRSKPKLIFPDLYAKLLVDRRIASSSLVQHVKITKRDIVGGHTQNLCKPPNVM